MAMQILDYTDIKCIRILYCWLQRINLRIYIKAMAMQIPWLYWYHLRSVGAAHSWIESKFYTTLLSVKIILDKHKHSTLTYALI